MTDIYFFHFLVNCLFNCRGL